MKRSFSSPTTFLFSALLLGISATAVDAADGETYQLAKKGYVRPVGTVVTSDTLMTMKNAAVHVEASGQEIEGKANRAASSQEIIEVLSATKTRTKIVKAEVESKMTINGQDQETPEEPEALLNTPFILELKDGKWAAALEAGEPTAAQKKGLKKKEEAANNDSDFEMYGSTPRKVGDEWKADPSKIGIGEGTDMKGDYTVKFLEVKDINGVKCAVLKATYDFKGKPDADAGNSAVLHMKGEAVSVRSITDLTDIDVQLNATMTLDMSPAEGVSVQIVGPTAMTQKTTLKKP